MLLKFLISKRTTQPPQIRVSKNIFEEREVNFDEQQMSLTQKGVSMEVQFSTAKGVVETITLQNVASWQN